jgi:hypothetical protein
MNTILKIDSPAIIGLFRKMTNEQVGKIIRAYLNNNTKDLIEEEKQIYTELANNREQQKTNNKDKILRGWETRRKNGNASSRAIKNQLQAQIQKDKDEMIKLRTENDTLKKASKQYNPNWNNNQNYNNNWKKKEEEPPKQPPKKPEKTEVGWNL